MATILLTGANGKSSTATIAALKGSGQKVIGLVRDAAKGKDLGIELRVADLERPRTLEGVFDGVDAAWLVAPPSPLAPYHASNALWAAKQAGVKHVVRMSAVGAAHDAPTVNSRLHALSDAEVAASGIPFTILKPHFFLQNLLFSAGTIAQEGAMYWAFGEAKFPAKRGSNSCVNILPARTWRDDAVLRLWLAAQLVISLTARPAGLSRC